VLPGHLFQGVPVLGSSNTAQITELPDDTRIASRKYQRGLSGSNTRSKDHFDLTNHPASLRAGEGPDGHSASTLEMLLDGLGYLAVIDLTALATQARAEYCWRGRRPRAGTHSEVWCGPVPWSGDPSSITGASSVAGFAYLFY
jgi:hypothetical protein